MYRKGWFLEEIHKVQEEVKKWPKWKLGEIEKNEKQQMKILPKKRKTEKNH